MRRADPSGKIRVLHVLQNLNYGGMERLVAAIARGADRGQFESHVLALQYAGRFAEEAGPQTRIHVAPPQRRLSLLHPKQLARQIATIAPDVVHTHSGVWFKASLAARMAGVPYLVHTEHGRRSPEPFGDRWIDRVAASRTDVVVAVSEMLANDLSRGIVRDASRIRVILNGVQFARPNPSQGELLRAELGIGQEVPIIGSIGRLEPVKGYDVMLQAFAVVRASMAGGEPVLVLAGDGSERTRLERLAERLGIRERTHFLGWRDNVPSLHAAFTIFTLSSHSEGTSVSLLEAMGAGLCPVVTDVGGNRHVLGPELESMLVEKSAPEPLAAAWKKVLTDAALRNRLAEHARKRVMVEFSQGAMVDAYEGVYRAGSEIRSKRLPPVAWRLQRSAP